MGVCFLLFLKHSEANFEANWRNPEPVVCGYFKSTPLPFLRSVNLPAVRMPA